VIVVPVSGDYQSNLRCDIYSYFLQILKSNRSRRFALHAGIYDNPIAVSEVH